MVAGVTAVALRLAFDDTTTPISAAQVVQRFRAEPTPEPATPTSVPVATPVPQITLAGPGVYLYTTTGQESVDVLGGATHRYPPETAVTVQRVGCGTRYRWDAIAERTEEWVLCEDQEGLVLERYSSMHRFFSQSDLESLTCPEPVLLVPTVPEPGASWEGTCGGDRVIELLTISVVGVGTETVDGGEVEVAEIRVDVEISSDDDSITGDSVSRYWFEVGSGLLVRWVETTETVVGSFVGDVTYIEAFDAHLARREPLT